MALGANPRSGKQLSFYHLHWAVRPMISRKEARVGGFSFIFNLSCRKSRKCKTIFPLYFHNNILMGDGTFMIRAGRGERLPEKGEWDPLPCYAKWDPLLLYA